MRITEHEISVFLWGAAIGAAIGSIITYLNTTREKRIVSRVRHDIDNLGGFLFDELTPAQCKRTRYPNAELVSDKQILEVHRWAEQWKKYRKSYNFRPPAYARFDSRENKISPTLLAAEVIICEELLGLSADDAIIACLRFKSLDDLKTLRNKDKEEADKRKKEAEAYEENYQRQWRGFKKRVFDGLSAVARGEKVRLDPETVEAAKGLMAYMGYKSESQDPESKKWTALLDDLSADPLRDAKPNFSLGTRLTG
jgi:hypothetical protein